MINIDKIFGLFNDYENSKDISDGDYTNYKTLRSYKVKMFKKIIQNFSGFEKVVAIFMEKAYPDEKPDQKEIQNIAKKVVYNRAYQYLILLSEEELEMFYINVDDTFLKCVEESIKYFVSTEEYEKCAFLVSLKNSKGILNLN